MSNWIKEEEERESQKKEEEARIQDFIARSDYWLKLRQQIERDVEYLNKDSIWVKHLSKNFIEIADSNGGYEIKQTVIPSVYITVVNQYETIQISIRSRKSIDAQYHIQNEKWIVVSDGVEVFLKGGFTQLVIPKQASEHILRPIVEALKQIPDA